MAYRSPTFDDGWTFLSDWSRDLRHALAFLTRIRWRGEEAAGADGLRSAVRAFPLAGLLIGFVGALAYALASGLGLPAIPAALVAVAVTVLITGALHEDGLADTADGVGAAASRERRLEIMRDSRIGAFGALALIFSVGLRVTALAGLVFPSDVAMALIGAHVVSRAALPLAMARVPRARSDGLGVWAGRPGDGAVAWSLGIGAVLALLFLGIGLGIIALIVAALAAGTIVGIARVRLGGVTGDVLGATQQAVEAAVLLAVLAAS